MDLGMVFFLANKKFLKKPNTQEYAQVLVVTCWMLNSEKCLLRTPPTSGGTKTELSLLFLIEMKTKFLTNWAVKVFFLDNGLLQNHHIDWFLKNLKPGCFHGNTI